MKPRSVKAIASAVFALIGIAVVATIAFFVLHKRTPPPPPPTQVPVQWTDVRSSFGHARHLGLPNIECKSCHDITASGEFKNPGFAVCAKCHENETAHTHAGGETTTCLTCHTFKPNQNAPTCIGCHKDAQGKHAGIVQHATTSCIDCHSPHRVPSVIAKDCTTAGCHAQRSGHPTVLGDGGVMAAMTHGLPSSFGPDAGSPVAVACQDCHKPHTPAKNADGACASCHAAPAGPKPAGHDSCLSCHKPHDFVASAGQGGAPTVCVGCHGAKPTLLATTGRAPAHDNCTSCHTPHAPQNAAASCQNCHGNVHPTHGAQNAPTNACITCHEPHAANPAVAAKACTSCHGAIATSETGAHGGHVECRGCHAPHDFAPKAKPAMCTTCHADEAAKTKHAAGHQNCTSCHGTSAHAPKAAPACATCHAAQASTAPVGHQKCNACHESHGGTQLPNATCDSCHQAEAKTTHGAHVQGGCATCHQPHGPNGPKGPPGADSVPACTTCHTQSKLPALHAVTAHGTCTTCHQAHAAPKADRATCTGTCHADRRDHQPGASVCTGCHVFRK